MVQSIQTAVFRKYALFAELDDRELETVAALAKSRRYAKDDVVMHADESGDVFCLIKEGHVKVTMISPEGKEIILNMLGPGDFFGEMALIDDEPRSATVVATEALEVWTIWRNEVPAKPNCANNSSAAPRMRSLVEKWWVVAAMPELL